MRRILFTVLASGLLCVAVPSIAAARHHNSKHHHRSHAGIRHEHFGATSTPTTPTAPTTPGTVTPTTSAGTVASFTNGALTLKLTDGSMVTGTVTANTELECQMGAPAQMQSDDHGGGGGDNGNNGASGAGDNGDNGDAGQCATTALTPGAVVAEADLSISNAGSAWDKVELA